MRRLPEDEGKTDFYDVWKCAVPEPFNKDLVLAARLRDLFKFSLLTYCCSSMHDPFAAFKKECEYTMY